MEIFTCLLSHAIMSSHRYAQTNTTALHVSQFCSYQRTFQKRLNVHCNFPILVSFIKFFIWFASSGFRAAAMLRCLAGLTLADVSKEKILIFLDPHRLQIQALRSLETPRKTRLGHRDWQRQTAVELEQRETDNGEKSYRARERNSAEEYFDRKETNKAREAVM